MLPKSQEPNWLVHLNPFAYDVMPNSTTGLQPYHLMLGIRAKTPCDNWQGLNNYDSSISVSKSSWVQEHHKLMQVANQCALKNIQKHADKNTLTTGGKELFIPEGNLVLLQDCPKGCNKIQDCFKDYKFVVVGQICRPNVSKI